jgi:uncharacterized membrane protein YphA (DoxX/SURF4 family)
MKIVNTILLVLLILLSISTGVVKLFQMEEEMKLFRGAGISDTLTILFGVVQTIGGVLLIVSKTRKLGAGIMAITFAIATVIVFINGMIAFGFSSILFIALAVYQYIKSD